VRIRLALDNAHAPIAEFRVEGHTRSGQVPLSLGVAHLTPPHGT
jgi:hypothetical protein